MSGCFQVEAREWRVSPVNNSLKLLNFSCYDPSNFMHVNAKIIFDCIWGEIVLALGRLPSVSVFMFSFGLGKSPEKNSKCGAVSGS